MAMNAVRPSVLILWFALAYCAAANDIVINVLDYGAKSNRKFDSTQAFMKAWQAVRRSPLRARLLVPKGEFLVSSMFFAGPCLSPLGVTVQVEGTIVAPTDPSEYVNGDWLFFQDLVGLNLVGGGTFDARGSSVWSTSQNCDNRPDDVQCRRSPATLQFNNVKNAVVQSIKSVDAMGYDMYITNSADITIQSVEIIAPAASPNTGDPIRLDASNNVKVSQTTVRHGTNCVSLARGPTDAAFTKSKCKP